MPIFAGFIATGGMTTFLWAINKSGWTNADMVRAIGGIFTKSYKNALGAGLIIAAAYLHMLSVLNLSNLYGEILVGGSIGFF